MDEFKRGSLSITDLKRIFQEDLDEPSNYNVTGGKFIKGRSSFDWKINA